MGNGLGLKQPSSYTGSGYRFGWSHPHGALCRGYREPNYSKEQTLRSNADVTGNRQWSVREGSHETPRGAHTRNGHFPVPIFETDNSFARRETRSPIGECCVILSVWKCMLACFCHASQRIFSSRTTLRTRLDY